MAKFAQVIIDISYEKLDKTFEYTIPQDLEECLKPGMRVDIPFGNRKNMTGYVVEITQEPSYDLAKLKPITGIVSGALPIESELIALASWMRENYGGTMNQALKTVLPVKKDLAQKEKRIITLKMEQSEAACVLGEYKRKHYAAKARLVDALLHNNEIAYELVTGKLHIQAATVRALEEAGVITVRYEKADWRSALPQMKRIDNHIILNKEQQSVYDQIVPELEKETPRPFLLYGVTGSGKTEVYMELIANAVAKGKSAIVLIPEIALTYQTVMRFYNRFGERVSVMHSKLSPGERYDQYERAKRGEIDVMIGPRSALFAPFSNLGIIIIDEEHETSYKSETIPRYHARETVIERARMCGALVVLGSATPSTDSMYKAKSGMYGFAALSHRVMDRRLATCEVVDLREELRKGNRSILSLSLQEKIQSRLNKNEQTMLFINRRGRLSFVSCRSCGDVIKCPHCDVSLSLHNGGKMICHYCGYETASPTVCPSCGSKYIGGFRAGTQRIEEIVEKRFPTARILRMDADTTRDKNGYERILSSFANHEADILIGTQMIVKGHDFPNVTLVGILAADISLGSSDYRASERTFALLTQAAGRAGRGEKEGEVVIQTYQPDHYSIRYAASQDYDSFYEEEISYRKLMRYPPVWHMLVILSAAKTEERADENSRAIYQYVQNCGIEKTMVIGPTDASIAKINDIYRKVIFVKHANYGTLVQIKDGVEKNVVNESKWNDVAIRFDFDPMGAF